MIGIITEYDDRASAGVIRSKENLDFPFDICHPDITIAGPWQRLRKGSEVSFNVRMDGEVGFIRL